jgi:hypothetical protein
MSLVVMRLRVVRLMMRNQLYIIKNAEIRKRAAEAVMALRGEDCAEVIIQPHEDDQTAQQRGYFHVLIKILATEIGDSPDSVKMDIKRETFGSDIVTSKITGKEQEVIKSSAKAKKDEYSQLIETTLRIAANFGIVLPAPNWRE